MGKKSWYKKINPLKYAKGAIKGVSGVFGGGKKDGTRSEAAGTMMNQNVSRQAGSGQVNFTSQTEV